MLKRLLLLFILLAPAARADLQWASTHLSTTVAPSDRLATAEFTFTNTGSYPVKVIGTHTSCGCTAAVSDGKAVAPGQTGKIEVTFKTLNRRGLYEEPILVDTNDPNAKETSIFLSVLIRDSIELLPTLLFWQPDEPLTAKVIRITVTQGFTLQSIYASCSNLDVQINVDPVTPGSDYKLIVTPHAHNLKATISINAAIQGKPPRVLTAHVRTI